MLKPKALSHPSICNNDQLGVIMLYWRPGPRGISSSLTNFWGTEMRNRRELMLSGLGIVLTAIGMLSGCKTIGRKETSKALEVNQAPGYCVAMRGNGDRINALFHSLARVVEHYGVPKAVAGGSSASITSFLLESILLNPIVQAATEEADRAQRAAFLLKAAWGYLEVVGEKEEGALLMGMAALQGQQGQPNAVNAANAAIAQAALDNSTLGDVVNKDELKRMIGSRENPTEADKKHQQDLKDQIQNFGQFKSDDPKMFFQPGLIDFAKLARAFSRMGDFFAGRGATGVGAFLDDAAMGALVRGCLDAAKDPAGNSKAWDDIKGLNYTKVDGNPGVCGTEFGALVLAYRQKHIDKVNSSEGLGFLSRADEPIGGFLPAIISTSVVFDADFVAKYKISLENYWQGLPLDFSPDFSKVRFGYWGTREDIAEIVKGKQSLIESQRFIDEKTSRFESLMGVRPGVPWFEALRTSPAEPGLAAAQFLDREKTVLSFGGWSDLQPVMVLKNRGCKNVVFITREAPEESSFARGIAKQLGIDEDTDKRLFTDLPLNPNDLSVGGGAQVALNQSAGAWCTNWNNIKSLPSKPIAADAYDAPLVFRSDYFKTSEVAGLFPYGNIVADLEANKPGCSTK